MMSTACRPSVVAVCCLLPALGCSSRGGAQPAPVAETPSPQRAKAVPFVMVCRDRPLDEVAAALGKHFGTTIGCGNLAKELVTVNLKGDSLWHVLCQLSCQTGSGLRGRMTDDAADLTDLCSPVKIWRPLGPGALVVTGPFRLWDSSGQPTARHGLRIEVHALRGDFAGQLGLSQVRVALPTGATRELKCEIPGYGVYELPDDILDKKASLSFRVRIMMCVDKHVESLDTRVGAGFATGDTVGKLTQWEERGAEIEGRCEVTWDFRLSSEECAKAKAMLGRWFASGGGPSEEEQEWGWKLMAAKRTPVKRISGLRLVGKDDEAVAPASESICWAPGAGCLAKFAFKKERVAAGSRLLLEAASLRPIDEVITIKGLLLTREPLNRGTEPGRKE